MLRLLFPRWAARPAAKLKLQRREAGFSLIENLVAVAILAVASVATLPVIATSFNVTAAARAQTSVLAEVEGFISEFRTMPYVTLLQKISSDIQTLSNGDSAEESKILEAGRAEIDFTFTAIKTQHLGIPEAVRVRILVTQRRGRLLPPIEYSFETIVTQVS